MVRSAACSTSRRRRCPPWSTPARRSRPISARGNSRRQFRAAHRGASMNIHEYQAKAVLREFGVPTPRGYAAFSVEEAVNAARNLATPVVVVKARIHAGGRGKAGARTGGKPSEDVQREATRLLGSILVTHQTGPHGKQVNRLYIEEGSAIERELYLSMLVDRSSARVAIVVSTEGGMDIEKVAHDTPDKIL